jgi:DNA-binding NarL/FixJ family response regulator
MMHTPELSKDSKKPADVWLVEDNEPFRRMLARTINSLRVYRCDHAYASAEAALEKLQVEEQPQLILLDIGLPGMDGVTALTHLRQLAPNCKLVMLTVFDDHDRIFGAVCGGADGYLLKTSSADEIARAIGEVLAGGASMTPQIARKVLDLMSHKKSMPSDVGLTSREADVLRAVVQGLTKLEIGQSLKISSHTVDTHLRSIYQKLHVNNRAGAVAAAMRQRLV